MGKNFSVFNFFLMVCSGTLNVTINKHLCKYNLTKFVTFNTEMPYLHNCQPYFARIRNISYKKLDLNMFKTKKSSLDFLKM